MNTYDDSPDPARRRELSAQQAARERAATERFLIVKGAYVAGIALLIAGSAYFLKYALDNMWIGMQGRIILGLLAGASALFLGSALEARGKRWTSEGVTALGGSLLYLSLWASWQPTFHVLPQLAACGLMLLTTGTLAALSYRRASETQAFGALLGAAITPLLLSYDTQPRTQLSAYLGILDVLFLALASFRKWDRVAIGAFVMSTFYSFQLLHISSPEAGIEAAALFAPFAFLAALRRNRVYDVLLVASSMCYAMSVEYDLADNAVALTTQLLSACGASLIAVLLTRNRAFAWNAAGFSVLAAPVQFHGNTWLAAWAVEAAVFALAGFRLPDGILRGMSLLLSGYVIAQCTGKYADFSAAKLFLNERFITLALATIALQTYCACHKSHHQILDETERSMAPYIRIITTCVALWMVSAEGYDAAFHAFASTQASTATLSVVWVLFACGLFVLGLREQDELLRWEGITLGATSVFKVLFFDLATLPSNERIFTSLGVGTVLTLLSFAYQVYIDRQEKEHPQ